MSDPVEKDERLGLPSASGMERLIACPGSWQLEQAARASGYKESSVYAQKGTKIHEANKTGDIAGLEISEVEFVHLVRKAEEDIFKEWCDSIEIKPEQVVIHRERREWIFNGATPIASVKVDFCAISGQDALVLDLKSGRKEVAVPAENWQLRTAGLALYQNHGLSDVRVGIVQPFAKRSPLCDYDSDAIAVCAKLIHAAIDKAKNADLRDLVPGNHCEYCLARHGCVARRNMDASVVSLRSARWDLIRPEEKSNLWLAAKQAEKYAKEIKIRIESELDADPRSAPGLIRKPSGETRSIESPSAAIEAAKTLWGPFSRLDLDTFTGMSVGGIEEVVAKTQCLTKEKAIEAVNTYLSKYIHREPRKGSVVAVKQLE